MPWTSKIGDTIILRDGRTIATLADARALILALNRTKRGPIGNMRQSYCSKRPSLATPRSKRLAISSSGRSKRIG
jgi:hypothetical protein